MDNEIDSTADSWMLCPLCNADLHYEYEIDYVMLRVEERCYCLSCGYTKKPVEATIH